MQGKKSERFISRKEFSNFFSFKRFHAGMIICKGAVASQLCTPNHWGPFSLICMP
jgi:hypothetical protein